MFGRYGADWQSLKATNLHGVPLLPYVCPIIRANCHGRLANGVECTSSATTWRNPDADCPRDQMDRLTSFRISQQRLLPICSFSIVCLDYLGLQSFGMPPRSFTKDGIRMETRSKSRRPRSKNSPRALLTGGSMSSRNLLCDEHIPLSKKSA
jgi:hypothetical protein